LILIKLEDLNDGSESSSSGIMSNMLLIIKEL